MSLFIGATVNRMLALPSMLKAKRVAQQELNQKIDTLVGLMNEKFRLEEGLDKDYKFIKIYDVKAIRGKELSIPDKLPKDSTIIVFEGFDNVKARLVIHANGTVQYATDEGSRLEGESYNIDKFIIGAKTLSKALTTALEDQRLTDRRKAVVA